MRDNNNEEIEHVVITYGASGYIAGYSSRPEKVLVASAGNTVMVASRAFTFAMQVDQLYWHNYAGLWRTTPIITSNGSPGVSKMLYTGKRQGGRHYKEELWLNGQLLTECETIIDENGFIVWSIITTPEGTVRLVRM